MDGAPAGVEPQPLAAWTDDNLDSYWRRRVLEPGARLLSPYGLVGLTEWACEWCVTSVSRLQHTLATGAMASKEGAAAYARATFPARWHRVIDEALCIPPGRSRSLAVPVPPNASARRPSVHGDGDRRRPPPVPQPKIRRPRDVGTGVAGLLLAPAHPDR